MEHCLWCHEYVLWSIDSDWRTWLGKWCHNLSIVWSIIEGCITCESTHEDAPSDTSYDTPWTWDRPLMIPSSNKNLKHVGYDKWNMCNTYVMMLGGYVSRLSTSSEDGLSGRRSGDMLHSVSIKVEEVFLPWASHSASSIAEALSMPISNLSNCRYTSKSCIICKKPNQVNKADHTKDASESVAVTWEGCFKLMVSTSESDLRLDLADKVWVSRFTLSHIGEELRPKV